MLVCSLYLACIESALRGGLLIVLWGFISSRAIWFKHGIKWSFMALISCEHKGTSEDAPREWLFLTQYCFFGKMLFSAQDLSQGMDMHEMRIESPCWFRNLVSIKGYAFEMEIRSTRANGAW